jgi:hypothetical protein
VIIKNITIHEIWSMYNKEIKHIIKNLELERMYYEPLKYIKKYIKSTKDIYDNKSVLKAISLDSISIEYIVGLISEDLEAKDSKELSV